MCLAIVLVQRVAPFERVWLFLLPLYFVGRERRRGTAVLKPRCRPTRGLLTDRQGRDGVENVFGDLGFGQSGQVRAAAVRPQQRHLIRVGAEDVG